MAVEPVVRTQSPFTNQEAAHLIRCIEMAITGYNRGQKVRPEFADIAKQIVNELTDLRDKVKKWPHTV